SRYVVFLKWMTLSLLAYVGTLFMVHVPWREVLYGTWVPAISWKATYLTSLIAVLGTTISPYLFFWQASEEAEEIRDHRNQHPLKHAPQEASTHLRRVFIDTTVGMGFSNLIGFFIILTAALTLHARGLYDITSAAQAAEALEPVVGRFAEQLFALG